MFKLISRYLIAFFMIPVGVVLGVCGWVQNRLRKKRYLELQAAIQTETDRSESEQ